MFPSPSWAVSGTGVEHALWRAVGQPPYRLGRLGTLRSGGHFQVSFYSELQPSLMISLLHSILLFDKIDMT